MTPNPVPGDSPLSTVAESIKFHVLPIEGVPSGNSTRKVPPRSAFPPTSRVEGPVAGIFQACVPSEPKTKLPENDALTLEPSTTKRRSRKPEPALTIADPERLIVLAALAVLRDSSSPATSSVPVTFSMPRPPPAPTLSAPVEPAEPVTTAKWPLDVMFSVPLVPAPSPSTTVGLG